MLAVFTNSADDRRKISIPKLWLPVGEYPYVLRENQHWYGIKYPEPNRGGIIYVRLERLEITDKPCRCPRLRFPHKRNASCEGGLSGSR